VEKNILKKEVDYRLSKMLLLNLYRDGVLSCEEAEELRKLMAKQYEPPIGMLDGGTEWQIDE
jgi:hypothetical protein